MICCSDTRNRKRLKTKKFLVPIRIPESFSSISDTDIRWIFRYRKLYSYPTFFTAFCYWGAGQCTARPLYRKAITSFIIVKSRRFTNCSIHLDKTCRMTPKSLRCDNSKRSYSLAVHRVYPRYCHILRLPKRKIKMKLKNMKKVLKKYCNLFLLKWIA